MAAAGLLHIGVLEPLANHVSVRTWAALLEVASGTPRALHPGFHPSLGALPMYTRQGIGNAITASMRTQTMRADLLVFLRDALGATFVDLERGLKRNLHVLRIDQCASVFPDLTAPITELLHEYTAVGAIEYSGSKRLGHVARIGSSCPRATCMSTMHTFQERLHSLKLSHTCVCTLPSLPRLRNLHMGHCPCVSELPSLAGFTDLRQLVLRDCLGLQSICNRIPKGLVHLQVVNCPALHNLAALSQCHRLLTLSMQRCPALTRLPTPLHTRLLSIRLGACPALEALVGLPPSLRELSLHGCEALHMLNLEGLVRLEALHIHRRHSRTRLGPLDGLVNLTTLSTGGVRVRLVPVDRARLSSLTMDGEAG